MVVLDTDILITYLREKENAHKIVRKLLCGELKTFYIKIEGLSVVIWRELR